MRVGAVVRGLVLMAASIGPGVGAQTGTALPDTCLLVAARNISTGSTNFFLYHLICRQELRLEPGDKLTYDVFLDPENGEPKGGVEILFTDGGDLRDSGAVDQEGRRAHGDADLSAAMGQWITRVIDLTHLAGKTMKQIDAQFEGDPPGQYVQFLDNIGIVGSAGTTWIYRDGPVPENRLDWRQGYSERVLCVEVVRERVRPPGLRSLLEEKLRSQRLFWARDEHVSTVRQAIQFLERDGRADIVKRIEEALAVPDPGTFAGSEADFLDRLHQLSRHLDHAHSAMDAWSGHLVGHAHIDYQWLWEWPETLEFSRQTFSQVIRFMKEFPEFTFTQSSPSLYLAMEEHYPELFAEITHFVREGRFEIVGGRWCEADTNIISDESHARHFLYGQRWFRSKFGRMATVGWEPDTFGHVWTLPQLLRLAGIHSYYFCRGGKGLPLFHWEGPDGTRVLAFDEPASGSWYNSDPGEQNFRELADFYDDTGLRELLWVYGVGNHGGGPTREQLKKVLSWMEDPRRPEVRFATADSFFATLWKERDLSGIPVVKDELNFVFRGCYTSHGDIKRLNRDAEALLVEAEAVALLASRSGFVYPRRMLTEAWKKVLWNHHHDTLPGTSIAPSYDYSRLLYRSAIDAANWVREAAIRHILERIPGGDRDRDLVFFNTLGWPRSGVLELPRETGREVEERARVWAGDVPAFGYTSHRPESNNRIPPPVEVFTSEEEVRLQNDKLTATFSRRKGVITSLRRRPGDLELLRGGFPGNVFAVALEGPRSMSAWTIGPIVEERPLVWDGLTVEGKGPLRASVRLRSTYGSGTTITQVVSLDAGSPRLVFDTQIDWQEVGSQSGTSPLLRVSFPVGTARSRARYSIPFGDKVREKDGHDVPALTWGAIENDQEMTVAILNDSKHGYSATGDGLLRLTLVRSSSWPDPRPDQYVHQVRYAIEPFPSGTAPSTITRSGFDFNTPLRARRGYTNAANNFADPRKAGPLPLADSLLTIEGSHFVPTCIKLSEDSHDWILRGYQAAAAPGLVWLKGRDFRKVSTVNLIEDPLRGGPAPWQQEIHSPEIRREPDGIRVQLGPYQIVTLRFDGR